MSLTGKTIDGRYEVLDILGEGGMGLVYEGRHVGLGRRVAIKVLHAEFLDVDQASRRFTQEAQIAGNLGHPNICEVTDVGVTEGDLPFMVMPLLEGQTLAEAMASCDGGFDAPRSVDIVSQILSALQPAHEAGIVHRDLKPENIFLIKAGDREDFVKVLDFGISKVMGGSDESLRRLTCTGMVMGTPYYMAPEQALGRKDLDSRVDIYAAGALLYELLTGRTPYKAESYNEIIVKIVNESPPMPRELIPDLPEALEAVVLKALSKEPDDRYATVSEFRDDLAEAAQGVETSVMPQRARRRKVTEPNTLSAAAAEMKEPTRTVSLHGTASRSSGRRWRWIAAGGAGLAVAVLAVVLVGLKVSGSFPDTGDRKQAPAQQQVGPPDASPLPPVSPPTVDIRFLGLPGDAKVTLGGIPVKDGQATVIRSPYKLHYRIETRGRDPFVGDVTPDRDQTLLIPLRAARAAPDAGVPGSGAPTSPPPMAPQAMTPPAMSPAAMSPGGGPAMRPLGGAHGRPGTTLKTDYDED